MIFCFDWPNIGTVQNYQDPSSQFPYIGSIQENFNVHVMFRTRPKLHSTMVMVKGHEWDVVRVKEATMQLITHMCGNLAVSNQMFCLFRSKCLCLLGITIGTKFKIVKTVNEINIIQCS